jgi:putative DNA primase/helicase
MNPHDQAAELAARFRLDKRVRSYAGDCPACSYPRAFSVRVGKSARLMLFCANGCARDVLQDAARRALGNTWTPQPAPDAAEVEAARGRKQAAALRLFSGSTAVAALDPSGRYLAHRELPHLIGRPALRFRGDCPHPEGGWLPAMVAEVLDVAGRPIAAHRTYLTPAGAKASADPAKASLGPVWGGAVRLDPIAPELAVGEGIETTASAGLLLGLPAWAAISAGNLAAGLVLPPEVQALVIAADPDPAGRDAATAASTRWQAEGRRVRIATPDQPGRDFNDVLQDRSKRAAGAAHG